MATPFFTGKGDDGRSGLFGSGSRRAKYDPIFELLGTLDELNAWIGLCRALSIREKCDPSLCSEPLKQVQHGLFTLQAQAAGADKALTPVKLTEIETAIALVAERTPPPATFCLPGGCLVSAYFDVARTIARRTERVYLKTWEHGGLPDWRSGSAYLNRLSSLLFALVRFTNRAEGVAEEAPQYSI